MTSAPPGCWRFLETEAGHCSSFASCWSLPSRQAMGPLVDCPAVYSLLSLLCAISKVAAEFLSKLFRSLWRPQPFSSFSFTVCHAELNAIMNKNSADVKGCSMYVALFPCNECAKLIIQAGRSQAFPLVTFARGAGSSAAPRSRLRSHVVTV